MHNSGKILIGIIIFLVLFTSPLWLNLLSGEKDKPELKYPTKADECILPKDEMASYHMDILDEWRHKVVREDERYFEFKGKLLEMSLTNTCLNCHDNKADFCDQCHNYLEVNPYCWDCHVDNKQSEEFDLEKFKEGYLHEFEHPEIEELSKDMPTEEEVPNEDE